jgi:hypothetical protein
MPYSSVPGSTSEFHLGHRDRLGPARIMSVRPRDLPEWGLFALMLQQSGYQPATLSIAGSRADFAGVVSPPSSKYPTRTEPSSRPAPSRSLSAKEEALLGDGLLQCVCRGTSDIGGEAD